ncbi:MAG TPA: hypothetical protein VGK00_12795 [Anaerolineales bacterium]|jgi:hypothetical protein
MILQDDDNLFDDGISYIDNAGSVWVSTSPVRQILLVTFALIAIYACFVGYRGGRSGQRFYNDRTIEKVLVPYSVFLLDGSALLRPSIFLSQIIFFTIVHAYSVDFRISIFIYQGGIKP